MNHISSGFSQLELKPQFHPSPTRKAKQDPNYAFSPIPNGTGSQCWKACRGFDFPWDPANTRGLGHAFPLRGLLPRHCRAPGRRPPGSLISLSTSACTSTQRALQGSQGHTEETFTSMSQCLRLQKATGTSLESGQQAQTKGLD